jgi:hypothetical protein
MTSRRVGWFVLIAAVTAGATLVSLPGAANAA